MALTNVVIDKLFEYMAWMRQYEAQLEYYDETPTATYDTLPSDIQFTTDQLNYTTILQDVLRNKYLETRLYFKDNLDQQRYMTYGYIYLRRLLIHYIASFKVILHFERNRTDLDYIDKELFLLSMGYIFQHIHNDEQKRMLCTTLTALYEKKGTPDSIYDIFGILGFSDIIYAEYWLHRQSANNFILKPRDARTGMALTGDIANFLTKPLTYMIDRDPHWYYNTSDLEAQYNKIKAIGDSKGIGLPILPSMTPYVSIVKVHNYSRDSILLFARINRDINDLYKNFVAYKNSNQNEVFYNNYRVIDIIVNETTSYKVSLLSLYLMAMYSFNRLNKTIGNSRQDVIPVQLSAQSNLDASIHYNNTLFANEFKAYFRKPVATYDEDGNLIKNERLDRKQLLDEIELNWYSQFAMVESGDSELWDRVDLAVIMNEVNPEFTAYVESIITEGYYDTTDDWFEAAYSLTYVLFTYIDRYVHQYYQFENYGMTPMSFTLMLEDKFITRIDDLKSVFNFFKPYPTRPVLFGSYILIDDVPGDCFRVHDEVDVSTEDHYIFDEKIGFVADEPKPSSRVITDITWRDEVIIGDEYDSIEFVPDRIGFVGDEPMPSKTVITDVTWRDEVIIGDES